MICVFVTFRYETGFDAEKIRKIADGARERFEGMPGLHSKIFAVDPTRQEARNVYVWTSESAARAFFTDELTQRVTALYGVRPSVEFAEIAALVENAVTKT
jgi:hypothetical protein